MFDVVAKKDISIKSFTTHIHTTIEEDVEIYTKSGSYLPAQADETQWEKIQGRLVEEPEGKGTGTRLPDLWTPIWMRAGETRAFYISLFTSNMDYSMGYGQHSDYIAENDDLAVTNGVSKEYLFQESFSPRKWDGEIHYEQYDLPELVAGLNYIGPPKRPSPAPTTFSYCAAETAVCGPDIGCPDEGSCCS